MPNYLNLANAKEISTLIQHFKSRKLFLFTTSIMLLKEDGSSELSSSVQMLNFENKEGIAQI